MSNTSKLKNVKFSFVLFILLIYKPTVKQNATEKSFCLNFRTANRSYKKIFERSSKCKENIKLIHSLKGFKRTSFNRTTQINIHMFDRNIFVK